MRQNSMNRARFTLAVGASCLALGMANGASAQTTPAPQEDANAQAPQADASANQDIVVTAQFREQRLQDTPLAITAVSAETMEARNQTNLAQVADAAVLLSSDLAAGMTATFANATGGALID